MLAISKVHIILSVTLPYSLICIQLSTGPRKQVMSPIYIPLYDRDSEAEQKPKSWQTSFNNRQNLTRSWALPLIILTLLITNVATLLHFSTVGKARAEPTPPSYGKPDLNGKRVFPYL